MHCGRVDGGGVGASRVGDGDAVGGGWGWCWSGW